MEMKRSLQMVDTKNKQYLLEARFCDFRPWEAPWQSLVLRRFADGLLAGCGADPGDWTKAHQGGNNNKEQQKSHRVREDRYEKLVMLVVVGI